MLFVMWIMGCLQTQSPTVARHIISDTLTTDTLLSKQRTGHIMDPADPHMVSEGGIDPSTLPYMDPSSLQYRPTHTAGDINTSGTTRYDQPIGATTTPGTDYTTSGTGYTATGTAYPATGTDYTSVTTSTAATSGTGYTTPPAAGYITSETPYPITDTKTATNPAAGTGYTPSGAFYPSAGEHPQDYMLQELSTGCFTCNSPGRLMCLVRNT